MKPASFRYLRPDCLEEALAHLSEYGDEAKLLAGGQSLVPTMNFRLAQPAVLVDLNRVEELAYIRPSRQDELAVGAMTRQRTVERSGAVFEHAPLITETMPHIAHPQIRNRGTFGGSVAHADPAAELPAVLLALDAKFKLCRKGAERWVKAREFFKGLMTTALSPDELLSEIVVPSRIPGTGWAFREAARRHGDFALVGVAALVKLDAASRCQDVRVVFLSVGDAPVEAMEAARTLIGNPPTEAAIRAAADTAASRDIDPPNDLHATAAFRRHLARGLCAEALSGALTQARRAGGR